MAEWRNWCGVDENSNNNDYNNVDEDDKIWLSSSSSPSLCFVYSVCFLLPSVFLALLGFYQLYNLYNKSWQENINVNDGHFYANINDDNGAGITNKIRVEEGEKLEEEGGGESENLKYSYISVLLNRVRFAHKLVISLLFSTAIESLALFIHVTISENGQVPDSFLSISWLVGLFAFCVNGFVALKEYSNLALYDIVVSPSFYLKSIILIELIIRILIAWVDIGEMAHDGEYILHSRSLCNFIFLAYNIFVQLCIWDLPASKNYSFLRTYYDSVGGNSGNGDNGSIGDGNDNPELLLLCHPETSSSIITRLTFSWVTPLLQLGYKRMLQKEDMFPMPPYEDTESTAKRFEDAYSAEMKEVAKRNRETLKKRRSRSDTDNTTHHDSGDIDTKLETVSLFRVLAREYGWEWGRNGLWKLVNDACVISGPLYLNYLVSYIEDGSPTWGESLLLILILFLIQFTKTICMTNYFQRMFRLSFVVRGGLMSFLYKKSMKITGPVRQACSAGEIVNLMSVDTQTVTYEMIPYLHLCWSTLLQASLCMFLLYYVMGISTLFTYAVLIIAVFPAIYVVKRIEELSKEMMSLRDKRTKTVNELLQGIKVVKFQSWGDSMKEKIFEIRKEELKVVKKIRYLEAFNNMLWSCLPVLASFAAFAAYSQIEGDLDPATVFTAVSLINVLKFPLIAFPYILIGTVMAVISVYRLQRFFAYDEIQKIWEDDDIININNDNDTNDKSEKVATEEEKKSLLNGIDDDDDDDDFDATSDMISWSKINSNSSGHKHHHHNHHHLDNNEDYPIILKNASFIWQNSPIISLDGKRWITPGAAEEINVGKELKDNQSKETPAKQNESEEPFLKNISCLIPRGKLTFIIGPVGSGKSSLLSALLGEMKLFEGEIIVDKKSTLTYVAQQPWIQNATLRDNITFGMDMDENKFQNIVDSVGLDLDIAVLPGGIFTEIGEKGINLSGGQKARVALARASYSNSDIYLMDDVLSAVDAHVSQLIFSKCICGLMLKSTRVLVTHSYQYLSQADHIIYIKDGKIEMQGTFEEWKSKGFHLIIESQSTLESHNLPKQNQLNEQQVQKQQSQPTDDENINNNNNNNNIVVTKKEEKEKEKEKEKETSTDEDDMKSIMSFIKDEEKKYKAELTSKEDRGIGSINFAVYESYLKAGTRNGFILMGICYLAWQSSMVANSIVLSEWSDADKISPYLEIMAGLTGINALFSYGANVMLAIVTVRASATLHQNLLSGVINAPMTFFDSTQTGRILNRFSKDIVGVDEEVSAGISALLDATLSVFGAFFIISYSTPYFLLSLLPVGYLYLHVQQFYRPTVRDVKRIESISRSPLYSHFSESLSGAVTIRATGKTCINRFCETNINLINEMNRSTYTYVSSNRWLSVRLEALGILVVIFSVALSIIQNEASTMNAALAGMSLTYALEITEQLSWIVRSVTQVETSFVAVERILVFAGLKPEPSRVMEKDSLLLSKSSHKTWPNNGSVEFRNVSLKYRPELDNVLSDVSFSVAGGERIGVVGRTGAGKSSLIVSLFRFVDCCDGNIFIDNVDIKTIGLDLLRNSISIIPQDPVLFSGSIRSNLDPFHHLVDDEIFEMLKLCQLYDKVMKLENGLNYLVAENGENFSVGERQLLCLTRALLKKSKILIMDEATASIDSQTDAAIQTAIRTVKDKHNFTIITIAHRLNTILDYDKILVLDRGKVAEFDTPSSLLQNTSGIFAELASKSGITSIPSNK